MSVAIEVARRGTDMRGRNLKVVVERVLLWVSVAGLIATVVRFYVRLDDAVVIIPQHEARLTSGEKWQAVQDDRWARVEKWMDRIERKMDRGPR